jgi:hypothetical protein
MIAEGAKEPREALKVSSQGAPEYDFGSQGCRFEPCRVQIKIQS